MARRFHVKTLAMSQCILGVGNSSPLLLFVGDVGLVAFGQDDSLVILVGLVEL